MSIYDWIMFPVRCFFTWLLWLFLTRVANGCNKAIGIATVHKYSILQHQAAANIKQ